MDGYRYVVIAAAALLAGTQGASAGASPIEEVVVTAPRLPGYLIEEIRALSQFTGEIALEPEPKLRLY